MLVIGPNPLFLRYIEKVLPSLGESGVTLSTISGLVHGLGIRGDDSPEVARLKGDARMARVVTHRGPDPSAPPRRNRTVDIPFGSAVLHLTTELTAQVVSAARRRPGTHNARRRFVEQLLIRRLGDEYQKTREGLGEARRRLRECTRGVRKMGSLWPTRTERQPMPLPPMPPMGMPTPTTNQKSSPRSVPSSTLPTSGAGSGGSRVVEALDRIWPRLSAEELLHDLFGAPPLLAMAAKGLLSPAEQRLLHRAQEHLPRRGALHRGGRRH